MSQSLVVAAAVLVAVLLGPVPGRAGEPDPPHPYRLWAFNHPHQVPADYVYRTGRVFTPPASPAWWQDWSWLSGGVASLVGSPAPEPIRSPGVALDSHVRLMAGELVRQLRQGQADSSTLSVVTFVNLNHLYRTSAFGRYLGEQLAGELQRAGLNVLDVRKTPGLMVQEGFGEYGLSRDMDELSFVHPAQGTVVGTYTCAGDEVFLNARMLRNTDAMLLASVTMVFRQNEVVRALLADEGVPAGQAAAVRVRALPVPAVTP
ncbi:MAG: FlgO family outer membrane protein [Thermodesulfobacteriota bacterium]